MVGSLIHKCEERLEEMFKTNGNFITQVFGNVLDIGI